MYRKEIPEQLLQTRNSETGVVRFSNPELTAMDLIQYEQHIGGLSRAATVLEELAEQTDFSTASEGLFNYTSVAAIQRLGFILESILEGKQQADVLYEQLRIYGRKLNYIPLSTRSNRVSWDKDTRWKINVNTEIETDNI
ncbi:type IV toxin-antitoxin system AbiEi family antitoxin [Proteiniphilum acetatigenes]|uniref:type IV toxin-antitoxin system AbiEi family antitoxin n=1 Tax=Proteiniphilum acetatigenes TaxID=294710 RepID=UPI00037A0AB0|nr:type IV toxin-antitoxin system AbiEi family antitoxin [Proteiniphilum acetatigenes]